MTDLPHVDPDGEAAWIAEHCDVDIATVEAILTMEFEYMVAVGIARPEHPGAPPWTFRYYQPGALDGAPCYVDCERIARDAERLAGVPYETAREVFNGELAFLQMRGLAGDG